jgi:hypothetical protein
LPHLTIRLSIFTPQAANKLGKQQHNIAMVRSKSRNGKVLLAHELANLDWTFLEATDSVDAKAAYFNNRILSLLDAYLPMRIVDRCVTDKPWITDEFHRLIRCRQYAFRNGEAERYRRLRNKVN